MKTMKGRKVKKKRVAIKVVTTIVILVLGFVAGAGYLAIRYLAQNVPRISVEYRPPSEEWEAKKMMQKAIAEEVQSQ